MKLRNKKTGEVVKIDLPIIDGDGWKISADSLAELNNEWEDVEDINVTNIPLIKNEKIRKAVRAWAEAFNVDVAYLAPIGDGSKFVELFNEDSDGFERIAIPAENIKQEQCYTITELCGEEEE